jgi:two-component system NtrC family sensor kinase
MEVIINISILMLAAILLIGFTTARINVQNIIDEKVRNGEGRAQDFQTFVDYLARDKKEFSLSYPLEKKEIQDFVRFYIRNRGLYDLVIMDQELKIVAGEKSDLLDKKSFDKLMKEAIKSGQVHSEIEKSGSFLSPNYKKLIVYSPLWIHGRIGGGIQMQIPIGDVMPHLLKSHEMILVSLILDAIVLIAFGSFLLSRVLVKPLRDLLGLTQKIAEGDLNQTIEVTSKNEIGQLIFSFNRMTERLRENRESISNHLKSLELANKKLKDAQEELIRTEKLASIGRFAAGVAHEVGNPLGAILGYTSLLEKGGTDAEEAKDYLKRIEKEIERINRIVRELLDFAKPSKFEVKEIEVNKSIENALSLLSHQKSFKNIETQVELQPDLPMIQGDESQLSQVLINILLNAIDAMPNGGHLGIQTEKLIVGNLPGDEFQLLFPPRRSGDPTESDYSRLRKADPFSTLLTKFSRGDRLIKIRIADTGIGIEQDHLERIFDPFFTTKDPDKGTGLGLSVSLRIVESMGGKIRVESQVEKGTTFEIYFPAMN